MTATSSPDPFLAYDAARRRLAETPDDRSAQHQLVLALARMGSLDQAIAEYAAYGLDDVDDSEDIMALEGRLYKDKFLAGHGADLSDIASKAAACYHRAFDRTGGYYAGVNAATMALLAGAAVSDVSDLADEVLSILPTQPSPLAEDRYFIDATRAECALLQGDLAAAERHLGFAVSYDPLNYVAHASTVKQFRMILDAQGADEYWLTPFFPPRAVHFAGGLWQVTNGEDAEALLGQLVDMIQEHDLGFGFGALAAGADLVAAEALLDQGCELHVVLPCRRDTFREQSVVTAGGDWPVRFDSALSRATTVRELPLDEISETGMVLAGRIAMGAAILKAQQLDVSPIQLLIRGGNGRGLYTSRHADDWTGTGYAQHVMNGALPDPAAAAPAATPVVLSGFADGSAPVRFESPIDAVRDAWARTQKGIGAALTFDLPGSDETLSTILNAEIPGTVICDEALALCLTVLSPSTVRSLFVGSVDTAGGKSVRAFSLQPAANEQNLVS